MVEGHKQMHSSKTQINKKTKWNSSGFYTYKKLKIIKSSISYLQMMGGKSNLSWPMELSYGIECEGSDFLHWALSIAPYCFSYAHWRVLIYLGSLGLLLESEDCYYWLLSFQCFYFLHIYCIRNGSGVSLQWPPELVQLLGQSR